jgi:hypothetical protein
MNLDLTDHEAALLLKELSGLIDGDRYFLSERIKTLKAIRAKIRPEPAREPLSPPPRIYASPRASAAKRRRGGRLDQPKLVGFDLSTPVVAAPDYAGMR